MPHVTGMEQNFRDTVERSSELSIQSHPRAGEQGGVFVVSWLAQAGMTVAPWWSKSRDRQLRQFWKKSDHLSGAMFTMTSKMTSIPFKIETRDMSSAKHERQAAEVSSRLLAGAEFGDGWVTFYSKFIEDLLGQDNGAFAEIIGEGDPNGPLIGLPLTIAHLDSFRCTRTGDPIFPVVYEDLDGSKHRMHFTRVMYAAQMPSPIADMYGVGVSSVSRCINVAQTLIDILTFKQEKLGSRPHRSILIPQGGLDPRDVQEAFNLAESAMDSQGLSRYSKVVLAGSSTMTEADLKVVELSSLPDGFDEQTSITLGMATIALAFGVDARELFPAMSAGATRADALLQHLKERGKGPGQILQITEQLFNHKFLPSHLKLVFDFQDDAQDRQVAEIRNIRSTRIRQDIDTQIYGVRRARIKMLEDGDLSRADFEYLELEDGRLPDGTSVIGLFLSDHEPVKTLLDLDVSDPTDIAGNDKDAMLAAIRERLKALTSIKLSGKAYEYDLELYRAIVALSHLERAYVEFLPEMPFSPFSIMPQMGPQAMDPRERFVDPRVRRQELTNPNVGRESATNQNAASDTSDDKPE
jgi:hypothetical protein